MNLNNPPLVPLVRRRSADATFRLSSQERQRRREHLELPHQIWLNKNLLEKKRQLIRLAREIRERMLSSKPFCDEEAYINPLADSQINLIVSIVESFAPDCPLCSFKRANFCLEKCCQQSRLFCWRCEPLEHLCHRKSDLYTLFTAPDTDKHHVLFREEEFKKIDSLCRERLKELREDLKLSATQQATIGEYVRLLCNCTATATYEEVESILQTAVFASDMDRVDTQNKKYFVQSVQMLRYYPEETVLAELKNFIDGLSESDVVGSIIKERFRFNTEKLLRSVPTFSNLMISLTNMKVIEDYPLQLAKCARRPMVVESCRSSIEATKLIVVPCQHPNEDCLSFLEFNHGVEELITPYCPSSFPPRLKSLSFYIWDDSLTTSKSLLPCLIASLPKTLQHLYICIPELLQRHLVYEFSHLPNLKYLALTCTHLTLKQIRSIVQFAIKNELRMLSFLYYTPIPKGLKEERRGYHERYRHCEIVSKKLVRHFLAYKRLMSQLIRINRTKSLWKTVWWENVIDSAKSEQDFKIEEEFYHIN